MADYKKLEQAENISIEQPNTYADQLAAAIANTNQPYKYDWNTDQLYQDYKKNYMTEAQLAKNNVIKAGKQLTAGYPDTYVDSAANQQYQTYLAEINRLAPAFENLAYSQHLMENEDALKQASMLAELGDTEYGRYRDLVSDAQDNRKYEFNNYTYDLGRELEDKKLADAIDSANKSYEQQLYLDRIKEAEEAKAAAEAAARAASSRGGGSGNGYGGYNYSPSGGNGLSIGYNVGTDYVYNGSSAANFTGVKEITSFLADEGKNGRASDITNPAVAVAVSAALQNQGYTQRQANAIVAQAKRNYRQN